MDIVPSRKGARRNQGSRAGFTLVELLVVIGIIALLISILLPALSKSRETANQVKCGAQQRQILQAMLLHAADHKGYIPLAGAMYAGTSPASLADAKMQKYDYYGTSATNAHIASVPAGLALYLGQEITFKDKASMQADLLKGPVRKVFVCPSDREGGRFGATVSDGGDHFNSYAFNEAAMGWADGGAPGQDPGVRNHNRLRGHLVRFPHAANLMLLTDGAPRGGDGGGAWQVWYDHDVNCVLGDVITGKHDCGESQLIDKTRHRGRMNVGFADGHVQNIVIAVNNNLTSGDLDKISLDVDFPR